MDAILQLENMTAARGGLQVLSVPSLEIAQGKVMAIVGPNGSGKTTLLLCMAGLLETTGGRLLFKGQEVRGSFGRAQLRRHITMAFQEPLLFNATVKGNIESGLRLHGVPKAERAQRAEKAAWMFDITHLLDRSARKLSWGESQRTSLARAFALRPAMLLLDEPFSGLDAPTKHSLLNDLGRILKNTSATTVFSTHDLTEALYLADCIAVLDGGQLAQCGAVEEIVNAPNEPFVTAALESVKAMAERTLKHMP